MLSLWFLYHVRDIILEIFVALLIMTILNPLVTGLSKLRIPRGISVLVTYLVVFFILGVALAGVLPTLVEQTSSFVNNLPSYLFSLGLDRFINDQIAAQFLGQLSTIPTQVVKFSFSLFSNILGVVSVLMFAFYLLLIRDKLDDQLSFFFGADKSKEIGKVIDLLEVRLGGWARGELALMVLVGSLNYLGLFLLGIPFALPLAILAGLLEIVPYIGPVIAAIPSVIIGLSISPVMGLAAAALAFLVQQLENYVFVPKVMEKSVGVSPIIVLLALAIGLKLAGIVGVMISVPLVIMLQVLAKEYLFVEKS
ncbi:hypothetical protein A2210_03065 [Candidatus Woesebacteria bacterium RIFOXYA1_FULL_40_18]|uniref:AI-2E family transporter n=2 Tax=Candidatus Woeseibacteriota TaxID=1752722 RepID=A0A1F8CIL1_9BACT|nr:MAG: hypothetical protein A2210_03065 [Candidatus Woesebacteria bacterium RIFOXYA1_FULL_40_18]OGM80994.1 MAG: hypothetical protein A2361_01490 [Candidatus Woesebacteria bacterium RIFOXYB1_FULL_40_26]